MGSRYLENITRILIAPPGPDLSPLKGCGTAACFFGGVWRDCLSFFFALGCSSYQFCPPGKNKHEEKGMWEPPKNVSVSTFQLPQAERAKQTVSALMALLFPLPSGGNCFSFLWGELWRLLAALQKNNRTTKRPYGGLQCRF